MINNQVSEKIRLKSPELIPPQKAGEHRTIIDKDGKKAVFISVPDLDGTPIALLQDRSDVDLDQPIPPDLQERGVTQYIPTAVTISDSDYFFQACQHFPNPLAGHLTFNKINRPKIDTLPQPINLPPPPLGLIGPPWSGKTSLLLSLAITNPQSHIGIHDLDKFGIESYWQCLPDLVQKVKEDPSILKSPTKITLTILDIYNQRRQSNLVPDTSSVTLKDSLDNLVRDYINPNFANRQFYLLDLPGQSPYVPKHIFQLLKYTFPTIDIEEVIARNPTLKRSSELARKVDWQNKFAGSKIISNYLYYLRQEIFNTRNSPSTDNLFTKAVSLYRDRQFHQ